MKTHSVHIVSISGEETVKDITENQAIAHGNINNVVFNLFGIRKETIKEIYLNEPNFNNIPGTHKVTTYRNDLEQYKKNRTRIEITWKKGHEVYFGYGSRTDGKKARCYIGKSTGWVPIYLQIDNSRSTGGPALSLSSVESITVVK